MKMQNLSVLHVPAHGSHPGLGTTPPPAALLFETCQRKIWIDPQGHELPARQTQASYPTYPSHPTCPTYQGDSAFAFLLEVICGLHSRVFGETEVLGQFKAFCKQHPELDPFGSWLLEDAKAIRSQLLTGIGSQSYGSIVRRWSGENTQAVILGTGQLAKKIAPWLKQARLLRSRDIATCKSEIQSLSQNDVVVIAAPIQDDCLTEIFLQSPPSLKWIDLRGTRGHFKATHTLEDLYLELERDQAHKQTLLPQARAEIARRAQARADRVICRPMGWDDIA